MEYNVGGVDRDARLIGGGFLLALGLFGPFHGGVRAAALGLGAMELTTGLTRRCPLNKALGVNTYTQDTGEAIEDAVEHATEQTKALTE